MGEITLVGAGHALLGGLLTLHVLRHKDRPVSAVLWMAVIWALPFLGALGYLSFGMDRVRRGAEAREEARAIVARRARGHPTFERYAVDEAHPHALQPPVGPGAHIFRATDPAVSRHRVLGGNRARLLVDGDEFYPALLSAIREARHTVHVQTYIFGRGEIGRRLREAFVDARRRGVDVRVLYDRFGSTWTHFSGFLQPARRAGVEVRSISQANPLKGRFQVNLRNHRKVVVVDGKVGFVGGINFHDRNTSRNGGPEIHDYHVELVGPAVADLQFQFVEDWHFATGAAPAELLGEDCFPEMEPAGEARAQVVPGGPEAEGRGLADAFFGAIVAADESVVIVTPYFVPDEPIVQAIRYAALRGVDVRLILPGRSNHWYMGFAARKLYTPLLEAGVRIFERGPPFMHAKALLVDDVYGMLGSANLDYRSLHLNFETNVEVVDPEFVASLRRQVEAELEASREVSLEEHRGRPLPVELAENFCYLFQPML